MTQQGDRQASVRAVTGTALSYEGDWHALFDAAGLAAGPFDGRMLAWINQKLSASYGSLPQAQQALAVANGAANFATMGSFDASGGTHFDYIITNDADWATVLALGSATLSGKTVGVMPGTYTAKTISGLSPANTITFKAVSGLPRIEQPRLLGSSKITFDGLEFVSSYWAADASNSHPAFGFGDGATTTTVDQITFRNCGFRGNYRGNPDFVFDPTSAGELIYPEYAAVEPTVINADGTLPTGVGSCSIRQPYVGDLLPDGDYAMVFSTDSGSGTGSAGTFHVSGGNITSAQITAAGAGWSTAHALNSVISWSGQHPFTQYLPFGLQRLGGGTTVGSFTVTGCRFYLCQSAVKVAPNAAPSVATIIGNTADCIYVDNWSFIASSTATTPAKIVLGFNVSTRPFCGQHDPGNPHADFLQFTLGAAATADLEVDIYGNILATGNARGCVEGLLCRNASGTVGLTGRVCGNLILNRYMTNGMDADNCSALLMYRNTVLRWNPTDAINVGSVAMSLGGSGGTSSLSHHALAGKNLTETISTSSSLGDLSTYPNTTVAFSNAWTNYNAVLANPSAGSTAVAELVANWAPQAGYAGQGAIGGGYVDFVGQTIDRTKEPTVAQFTGQTGIAVGSTNVTSEWSRILGGPDTIPISIAGGEYRTADDASGTNATAWGASSGTVAHGKWVQVRQNASAAGSTTTTATVTLNGYNWAFQVTTASAASFTLINNSATAWSKVTSPSSDTNVAKVLIGMQFKMATASVTNMILFGDALSKFILQWTSASALRLTLHGGTSYRASAAVTADTNLHTLLWSIDLTQATGAASSLAYLDGNSVGLTVSNYTASTLLAMASDMAVLGLFAKGDGTTPINGALGFLWIDWGTSGYTLPDLTSSTVRNKFTADNINLTDGSGVTGSKPKLFYPGNSNLSSWNGTLANAGSATASLVKQAGTYS
jgi:hypothetical protein